VASKGRRTTVTVRLERRCSAHWVNPGSLRARHSSALLACSACAAGGRETAGLSHGACRLVGGIPREAARTLAAAYARRAGRSRVHENVGKLFLKDDHLADRAVFALWPGEGVIPASTVRRTAESAVAYAYCSRSTGGADVSTPEIKVLAVRASLRCITPELQRVCKGKFPRLDPMHAFGEICRGHRCPDSPSPRDAPRAASAELAA
jgi:hypothetical protein